MFVVRKHTVRSFSDHASFSSFPGVPLEILSWNDLKNRQTVLKMKFKLPLLVPRINIPRTLAAAGCHHLTPKYTCLFPYISEIVYVSKAEYA